MVEHAQRKRSRAAIFCDEEKLRLTSLNLRQFLRIASRKMLSCERKFLLVSKLFFFQYFDWLILALFFRSSIHRQLCEFRTEFILQFNSYCIRYSTYKNSPGSNPRRNYQQKRAQVQKPRSLHTRRHHRTFRASYSGTIFQSRSIRRRQRHLF